MPTIAIDSGYRVYTTRKFALDALRQSEPTLDIWLSCDTRARGVEVFTAFGVTEVYEVEFKLYSDFDSEAYEADGGMEPGSEVELYDYWLGYYFDYKWSNLTIYADEDGLEING